MTVKFVPHSPPAIRNGVGSFILQCSRITLQYCNWGGSSKGMREFLKTQLKGVAAEHPEVEFVIRKESGHPVIKGDYVSGNQKAICVRNMPVSEIKQKIQLLRDSSGDQLKKYKNPVSSDNRSVRGVWSPFHVEKPYRHKV